MRNEELGKSKIIDGYWTYAHTKDLVWEHSSFETKEEAVVAGRDVFPCGFTIGQIKYDENKKFHIVNTEKLTFS